MSSSLRLYYEELGKHPHHPDWIARDSLLASGDYCPVPTGIMCGATEIIQPPRAWAKLAFNVAHWSDAGCKGGHFLALENPRALAADVRAFLLSERGFDHGVKLCPVRGTRRPYSAVQNFVLLAIIVFGIVSWLSHVVPLN